MKTGKIEVLLPSTNLGKYKLYIGIYDDVKNTPKIKLAVKTRDINGLDLLGDVFIQ